MSTFVGDLHQSLEDRWIEVTTFLNLAKDEEDKASLLYNASCRATLLFIVAHFEATIKEVAKAIINDINKYSSFDKVPSALKRTYCRPFIASTEEASKEVEQRTKKLISVLDNLDVKMDGSHFIRENRFGNDNQNPSPSVIDKICSNFGISRLFCLLKESDIEVVFKDASSETEELYSRMMQYINETTSSYPYACSLEEFNFLDKPKCKERTFYETFLDELLKKRHEIAHGSATINNISVADLNDYYIKVKIFLCAFIIIMCHFSLSSDL